MKRISLPGVAWFFALLVACYAPILYRLAVQWSNDPDMGHGFLVPMLAAYIAWTKRPELESAELKSSPLGLLMLVFGAVLSIVGTLGVELFMSRTAFVFSVIGAVWFLGGIQALRILSFPLFLLFFMIPIPAIVYNQITFPLQLIASQIAEFVLGVVGIPVLRDGNILELPSQRLSVVEACSGIRSLLSLSFLALVYGHFCEPRMWMRVVLFLATVPFAIGANAGRVTATGVLSEINPALTHGLAHDILGWMVFVVALGGLIAFHQLLLRITRMRSSG